jgi:anti-sigma regulatory factor (Ser/Thr protein kinase)
VPGVRRIGLALTQGGGRQLIFTASDRVTERGVEWCDVDAFEDVPLNNAVRTGKPVVGSLEELGDRYPEFVGRQSDHVRALASIPVSAAGQVLGGFVLFYGTPQRFDDPEVGRLHDLGKELGERLQQAMGGGTARTRSLTDEPVPARALVATHDVAADTRAVGVAREFVRSSLAAWGIEREIRDTAVLCVSELVTNALIHTDAGCEIRLVLHEGLLTTTVRDAGTPATRPERRVEDPLAVRGRGLQLVDALCARWGSELNSLGMTVWCELGVT